MDTPTHNKRPRRRTPQREAIRNVFRRDPRPLGVAEILERAQAEVPALNQATVYRTVNMLVNDGWLTRVVHSEVGALYECAGKGHHHHFYCRQCRRVFELAGCPLSDGMSVPAGFTAEGHELFLHGLCRECAQDAPPAAATESE